MYKYKYYQPSNIYAKNAIIGFKMILQKLHPNHNST